MKEHLLFWMCNWLNHWIHGNKNQPYRICVFWSNHIMCIRVFFWQETSLVHMFEVRITTFVSGFLYLFSPPFEPSFHSYVKSFKGLLFLAFLSSLASFLLSILFQQRVAFISSPLFFCSPCVSSLFFLLSVCGLFSSRNNALPFIISSCITLCVMSFYLSHL